MRRLALFVGAFGALVAVVLVAGASGVSSSAGPAAGAVFWTRGVIEGLAADGSRVAAVTGELPGCARIVVWTAPGRKFAVFPTHVDCPPRAYTSYLAGVAMGAGRVAWIEGAEGNGQDLYLYAASVSGGPSKRLDTAYNGSGETGDPAGEYLGQLFGAGGLLAYNKWSECSDFAEGGGERPTADCPAMGRVSGERLKWLSPAGRLQTKSGSRAAFLLAVGGGRMAVRSLWPDAEYGVASGTVEVLSASGTLLASIPAKADDPPSALALSGNRLVIEGRRSLDVRSSATGKLIRTIPLGSSAHFLTSINSKLAVLATHGHLALVRLSDGRRVNLPHPAEATGSAWPVTARLTDAGLFYAYNVPTTPAKGRIVFIPTQQLLVPFR